MIRLPSSFALAFFFSSMLAACGAQYVDPYADGSSDAGRVDGARPDAFVTDTVTRPDATDAQSRPDVQTAFMTAEHEPFPTIPNRGGRHMTHPQLVVVTYSDDPLRADDVRYSTAMMSSNWMNTVGREYGVTGGSLLGTVELPGPAPHAISSPEIETMIRDNVQNGTFPRPADGSLQDVLYMVFYPPATQITLEYMGESSRSCETFGGYHYVTRLGGVNVAYAAIPTCSGGGPGLSDVDGVQIAASHELIEAATDADPFEHPGWSFSENAFTAWIMLGAEVADLCVGQPAYESNFPFARVWSNEAAARGGDPCIPTDPADVFFNVSSTPDQLLEATPGTTMHIDLTGWSTARIPNWTLEVVTTGTAQWVHRLGARTMNNGMTTTLDITIPASAQSGTYEAFTLYSIRNRTEYHVWPVVVYVP